MNKHLKKYVLILFLFGIAAVIAGLLLFLPSEPEKVIDSSNWETYTNRHYGFTLRYPPDWVVNESPADPDAPVYNIYKPGSDRLKLPFDHHTEGVTHVSVYPKGIPTEGVFGRSEKSGVRFSETVNNKRDYILEDGTAWATIAHFTNFPATWSGAGFIFASVDIKDLEAECLRDGGRITNDECEPLFGDMVVRSGKIDEYERQIIVSILESFRFLEEGEIAKNSYKDLIRVDNPAPESIVTSPLTIEGEARGSWYFEGSFPVVLTDWDGRIIAEGIAQAQDDWMTTDYVPFDVTLRFDVDTRVSNRGSLILQKENPSGLPGKDDAYEYFVFFEKTDLKSFEGDISLALTGIE